MWTVPPPVNADDVSIKAPVIYSSEINGVLTDEAAEDMVLTEDLVLSSEWAERLSKTLKRKKRKAHKSHGRSIDK